MLTSSRAGRLSLRGAVGKCALPLKKAGFDLLHDPKFNKGSAFTKEERARLHLRGFLPYKVFTLAEQVARIKRQFEAMPTPLLKYVYLTSERERNETSFWKFLFSQAPEVTMPVLYTPTVGEACTKWATFRNNYRGIYITPDDKGSIKEILKNYPNQGIRCIVVTDGGRILGLGDLGASGLGIPVGKLILYTLCGQVNPDYCLPIQLDAGTNRKELLDDPLYHGWRHPRLRGQEHLEFVEEFVEAVKSVFGATCLIQWEDFEMETAFKLLDYFRWKCNSFNDDIEGTAAVTAAAVACAPRIKGVKPLAEQKIVFLGAGSAATGIGNLIVDMAAAQSGVAKEKLFKNIFMFDHKGEIVKSRTDLFDFNIPFAHDKKPAKDIVDLIKTEGITGIIGVSGQPGLITKEIVEALCKNTERPLVFALSNPTVKAECSAEQAYQWSNEKALFCSGSPFPDYKAKSGKTLVPSQSNNSWIFPAVGLALVTAQAKHCPAKVFEVSALALASLTKEEDLEISSLLPPLSKIREYAYDISLAVAKYLYAEGLATAELPPGVTLEKFLKDAQFNPPAEYETELY